MPNISNDPVSTEKIIATMNGVLGPIATAKGLPNPCYTDSHYAEYERDFVLGKSWASLAFTNELPEAGYAKPIEFMGTPLLLVRDKSDEVRVFHNVCSHRGLRLCEQEKKIRNLIRCPYHAWAYSCDGQLKKTPNIGGVNVHTIEDFNTSSHGLKTVRHAIWMNIIFINLSADAESFDDFIAPLEKRWQIYFGKQDRNSIKPAVTGSDLEMGVNCNWKLAIDNYCEAYHLPTVHPDLNRQSPLDKHYNITDGDGMSGQGSERYTAAEVDNKKLPVIDGWPSDRLQQAEYISLYPNTLLGIQADHFFSLLVIPKEAEVSHEKLQISYMGDAAQAQEFQALREAVLKSWQVVFSEDVFAVEGMQRGRHSPAYDGGVLTPLQDIPTHHFHAWVAKRYIDALS